MKAQPDTQSPERGVTTVEHDQTSGGLCVERQVRLLRDPDAMQQDGKLACDGNDGLVTRLFATAKRQVQAPLSQRRVSSSRSKDVVGTLDKQRSQIDVASLRDTQLRIVVAGLTSPWP